jgi:hypothetical protein
LRRAASRRTSSSRALHALDAVGRDRAGLGIALEPALDRGAVAVALLLGDAEQRADHVHRQLVRERRLEVEVLAAPADRIEVALREPPHLDLERGDAPRREALRDQVPHAHVARRIHADDRHQLARHLAAVL